MYEHWQETGEVTIGKNNKMWTPEEDQLLRDMVVVFGTSEWAKIALKMGNRNGRQCRERWRNQLDPTICKDPWTREEELILLEAHQRLGSKWTEISKLLPGRTDNTIKNHWNSANRRLMRQQHPNNAALRKNIDAVAAEGGPTDIFALTNRTAKNPTILDGKNGATAADYSQAKKRSLESADGSALETSEAVDKPDVSSSSSNVNQHINTTTTTSATTATTTTAAKILALGCDDSDSEEEEVEEEQAEAQQKKQRK